MKHFIVALIILILAVSACGPKPTIEEQQTEEAAPEPTPVPVADEPKEEVKEVPAPEPVEETPAAPVEPVQPAPAAEPTTSTPTTSTPQTTTVAPTTTPAPAPEGLVRLGAFQRVEFDVHGNAEIHVTKGKKVLKLVDFSVENPNDKELRVVLAEHVKPEKSGQVEAGYTDLGVLEANKLMYDIPDSVNLVNVGSVVIYYMKVPQRVYALATLRTP
ncbi:hypothetical protein J4457_02395 [Candidatus Woesearchaeota archaeon]|nr:hypothetical protein [Candidatus Woesearchaeota archaeon]